MTGAQKNDIYELLKKTKSWTLGYIPAEFNGNAPAFIDDVEESAPQAYTAPQAAMPTALDPLASKIASCRNCILAKTRKNVVPGKVSRIPSSW